MTASIGIWAQSEPTGDVVLYRCEADGQTGFVTFEVEPRRFRPADGGGDDDLLYDPVAGYRGVPWWWARCGQLISDTSRSKHGGADRSHALINGSVAKNPQ